MRQRKAMSSREPPTDRIDGIERAPRRRQYENIPLPLIRDERLSYRALGVLTRLLSNADSFRMNSADLARERKEGRDAVRAALGELEAAGYIVREKRQNTRGQWSTVMVVSEESSNRPEPQSAGFQASVFQSPVFQASENQALKSSNTNKHHQEEKTTTAGSLNWAALPQLSIDDQAVVVGIVKRLEPDQQQTMLDELAGALRANAITGQWPGWLHGVVQKAGEGGYQPNYALAIQSERKRRVEAELRAKQQRAEAEARNARLSNPEAKARGKANLEAIGALLRP